MQPIQVETRQGPASVSHISPVLDHPSGHVTAWQFRLTLDSGDGVTLAEDFQVASVDRKPVGQWRMQELATLIRTMASNAKVHTFVQTFEGQRASRLDTTFTEAQLIEDGV